MQENWRTIPCFNIAQRMSINAEPELKKELFFMEGIYEQVLAYMTQEMNKNTQSETFKNLQVMLTEGKLVELGLQLYELFRSGGEWDHKPMLQKLTLPVITRSYSKKLFVTPIRGDTRYLYYYDIWSNIHYGYVLEKLGFRESWSDASAWVHGFGSAYSKAVIKDTSLIADTLTGKKSFRQYVQGTTENRAQFINQLAAETEDHLSVEIGQRLARQSGQHLDSQELHNIIYNQRLYWDEGEVRFRWEALKLFERPHT